jgi:hypothetical protein
MRNLYVAEAAAPAMRIQSSASAVPVVTLPIPTDQPQTLAKDGTGMERGRLFPAALNVVDIVDNKENGQVSITAAVGLSPSASPANGAMRGTEETVFAQVSKPFGTGARDTPQADLSTHFCEQRCGWRRQPL